MTAYEAYNEGKMVNHIPTDEELELGFATIPAVPGVQQAGGLAL
jgi:tryptophan synthase beta chain